MKNKVSHEKIKKKDGIPPSCVGCDDVAIITFCKDCKTVYMVDSVGYRQELDLELEELFRVLKNHIGFRDFIGL